MSDVEGYRRKSAELLRRATQATDFAERSRLLQEAVAWQKKAIDALDGTRAPKPDKPGEDG